MGNSSRKACVKAETTAAHAMKRVRITKKSSVVAPRHRDTSTARCGNGTDVQLRSQEQCLTTRPDGSSEEVKSQSSQQHIKRNGGELVETNTLDRSTKVCNTASGRKVIIETMTVKRTKYV